MRRLVFLLLAAFGTVAPASAQIVAKYSGIQPLDRPASFAEQYFGEQVNLLTKGA